DLSSLPWWKRWVGADAGRPVSFVAASCRWPGMAFEHDAVDALARQIESHVTDDDLPIDALVLLGDQIYADATANVAETTEEAERGAGRYRESWGAPATQRLFSRIPTWMVVDDHEIGDNVNGGGGPGTSARRSA